MSTLDAITWTMISALWGVAGFSAGYYFGRKRKRASLQE
jgi:LPXTG-motif cell wall-anchored protein